MSSFDIKTAIALLPVMTGQEQTTKQLIDSILLYSSMLSDNFQPILLEFILKTRLSASAKLRLKSSYDSVKALVEDMRKHLLPKKSAEAIQSKLFRSVQGRRSVESFGNEIEELFVNLTIAQSEENPSKFELLRPINEKTAIKRFADGLSDSRLSTIIASRQFGSLPEAIRSALDEQTSSSSSGNKEIMNFRRNNYLHKSFIPNKNNSTYHSNFNTRNYKNNYKPELNNTRTYFNPGHRGKRPQTFQRNFQHAKRAPRVQLTQQSDEQRLSTTSDDTNNIENKFFRP